MRKARQRALKQAVKRLTGRPVHGVVIVGTDSAKGTSYVPSEWRRIKKAFMAARAGA